MLLFLYFGRQGEFLHLKESACRNKTSKDFKILDSRKHLSWVHLLPWLCEVLVPSCVLQERLSCLLLLCSVSQPSNSGSKVFLGLLELPLLWVAFSANGDMTATTMKTIIFLLVASSQKGLHREHLGPVLDIVAMPVISTRGWWLLPQSIALSSLGSSMDRADRRGHRGLRTVVSSEGLSQEEFTHHCVHSRPAASSDLS